MTKLPGCPFCGSFDVQEFGYFDNLNYDMLTAVECQNCGARGPKHLNFNQAKELWATRYAPIHGVTTIVAGNLGNKPGLSLSTDPIGSRKIKHDN